ncbi:TPA: hypothetical protein MIQ32_10665 [Klebsiella quasipneumoniae]|nr:hypothetical protein [Klebsiella quasipneumoniae]
MLPLSRKQSGWRSGPYKRSAAGRDARRSTRDVAGWRLRLTRPTSSSHRLTPRRPGQAQRRRATTAGTKPSLCRMATHALSGLQRLNPQKHLSAPLFQPPAQSVGPRKRSAAGQ